MLCQRMLNLNKSEKSEKHGKSHKLELISKDTWAYITKEIMVNYREKQQDCNDASPQVRNIDSKLVSDKNKLNMRQTLMEEHKPHQHNRKRKQSFTHF